MSDVLSTNEREARLLYSVIVAGKSAAFADRALRMLLSRSRGMGPFDTIRRLIADDYLERALKLDRVGNYTKTEKCFRQLVDSSLDLLTCTPQDLEAIHGIGPKTARFFILWTRPGERYAALDVHVLRWLRAKGYEAPRATPGSSKKYAELERAFLDEADRVGVSPREFDAMIWDAGSKRTAEAVA